MQRLDEIEQRLVRASRRVLEKKSAALALLSGVLDRLSPLKTLERGYAIASVAGGHVLTDAAAVQAGDAVALKLHRGEVDCRVTAHEDQGMKRLLLALLVIGLSGSCLAAELPQARAVPGGVAVVEIAKGGAAPKAWFEGRRVLTVKDGERWLAIVGLSLAHEPGEYEVSTSQGGNEEDVEFHVSARKYPEQRLTVKNPRHVNPNASDLKRISKENVRIGAAKRHYTASAPAATAVQAAGLRRAQLGLRPAPLLQR